MGSGRGLLPLGEGETPLLLQLACKRSDRGLVGKASGRVEAALRRYRLTPLDAKFAQVARPTYTAGSSTWGNPS